jgi:hypothetical protein
MDVIKAIKFIYNNYDVILQGILTIVSSLCAILEVINRFIPNKGDESAISKIGKSIAKFGE